MAKRKGEICVLGDDNRDPIAQILWPQPVSVTQKGLGAYLSGGMLGASLHSGGLNVPICEVDEVQLQEPYGLSGCRKQHDRPVARSWLLQGPATVVRPWNSLPSWIPFPPLSKEEGQTSDSLPRLFLGLIEGSRLCWKERESCAPFLGKNERPISSTAGTSEPLASAESFLGNHLKHQKKNLSTQKNTHYLLYQEHPEC